MTGELTMIDHQQLGNQRPIDDRLEKMPTGPEHGTSMRNNLSNNALNRQALDQF
jgi:hypothetical protein